MSKQLKTSFAMNVDPSAQGLCQPGAFMQKEKLHRYAGFARLQENQECLEKFVQNKVNGGHLKIVNEGESTSWQHEKLKSGKPVYDHLTSMNT